jgi:hypothetical protein
MLNYVVDAIVPIFNVIPAVDVKVGSDATDGFHTHITASLAPDFNLAALYRLRYAPVIYSNYLGYLTACYPFSHVASPVWPYYSHLLLLPGVPGG